MKSINRMLILIILITALSGCSLFNIGTTEWSVSGSISDEFSRPGVLLAAFFTNGSRSDMEPLLDMDTCRLVSNIDEVADGKYSLEITAPDGNVTHDVYSNYIDVIFWVDNNGNDELDSGDEYCFAVSAEDNSVLPFWVSFYKTGEKFAGVPYRWEAYSITTYPVAFLEMTDVNIKPYGNWKVADE